MNYLVFVDVQAGELEKILSGMKTMLVKEFDPAHSPTHPINPGDSLYFLRDQGDRDLRVKATVVRVLFVTNRMNGDLPQTLKVMQPRLQLTEEQYNHWSVKQRALLVEFGYARKIGVIHIAPEKLADSPAWIAFKTFDLITHDRKDLE